MKHVNNQLFADSSRLPDSRKLVPKVSNQRDKERRTVIATPPSFLPPCERKPDKFYLPPPSS